MNFGFFVNEYYICVTQLIVVLITSSILHSEKLYKMQLERYKVTFRNNKPSSAAKIDWKAPGSIKIGRDGDKRFVDWYVVYGTNEMDAIEKAAFGLDDTLKSFLSN